MGADKKLAKILLKVQRAEKHMADLDSGLGAFLRSNPYEIVPNKDEKTGLIDSFRVVGVAEVPDPLRCIAGDVIQNLRSALDHLAHQLALMVPGADPNQYVDFPLWNSTKDFEAAFRKGKVDCFRKDAKDLLLVAQPYRGGKGHELWVLNRLNNIDKHRLLLAVGSSWFDDLDMEAVFRYTVPEIASKYPVGFGQNLYMRSANPCISRLKAGDILPVRPEHKQPGQKLQLRFAISLHEPEIIEGKSINDACRHFAELVRNTVTAFKPCLA